jgi:hypothetical protein
MSLNQKYYNPLSLKDTDALTPDLHISKLIESLSPADVKTDRVIVMAPKYLKDLNKLISSTPKSVFNTYFQWKAIQAFYPYVEADAITPYKRFINELQGKVNHPSKILHPPDRKGLTLPRILNPPPNAGEHVSTMRTTAWAGFSRASSWKRLSLPRRKNLVIKSYQTSRTSLSRNLRKQHGWRKR